MTIVIQRNNSENNRAVKSLTELITLDGNLKQETSIVDPVITVSVTGANNTHGIEALQHANYMTINAFDRSYFITDIVSVSQDMVEIHAHCDVVSSFYEQYKDNVAVIGRQQNSYNKYLNDSQFKIYQDRNVITAPLSGSGFGQAGFILVTAGG